MLTQDVLGLQVPVGDAFVMQEVQGAGHVLHHHAGLQLVEVPPLVDVVQDGAAPHLLKHQVEAVLFLEELDQLQNVSVSLALVQHLHLPEDPAPNVARLLLDDLDRVLLVGDEVDASLHAGVGALPQHVLLQLVDVFEPAREAVGGAAPFLLLAPLLGVRDVDGLAGGHVGAGLELRAAVRVPQVGLL